MSSFNSRQCNEVFQNTAEYMNSIQPYILLLFAWNYFGKRNAKHAQIVNLNENGVTVSVKNSAGGATEELWYPFPNKPIKPTEVARVMGDIFSKYSGVTRPPLFLAMVFIFIWFVFIIGVTSDADVTRYPFLEFMRPYVCKYLSLSQASWGLAFLIISHTIEGLYVSYLCNVMKLPKTSMVSWVMMTFFIGYPTTSKVMELHAYYSKSLKRKQQK